MLVIKQVIKQISFNGKLDRAGQTKMLFIIEKAKEAILDFSKEIVRLL